MQANVADRDLGSVIEDVRAAITQRVQLPQGYFVQYGGQFESQEKASRQILLLSIVAIALGGIFTSTFLNMMVIPALYLKYGRAEAPSPTRDYPQNRKLAPSGD